MPLMEVKNTVPVSHVATRFTGAVINGNGGGFLDRSGFMDPG
jgi:hypothetical protein